MFKTLESQFIEFNGWWSIHWIIQQPKQSTKTINHRLSVVSPSNWLSFEGQTPYLLPNKVCTNHPQGWIALLQDFSAAEPKDSMINKWCNLGIPRMIPVENLRVEDIMYDLEYGIIGSFMTRIISNKRPYHFGWWPLGVETVRFLMVGSIIQISCQRSFRCANLFCVPWPLIPSHNVVLFHGDLLALSSKLLELASDWSAMIWSHHDQSAIA